MTRSQSVAGRGNRGCKCPQGRATGGESEGKKVGVGGSGVGNKTEAVLEVTTWGTL